MSHIQKEQSPPAGFRILDLFAGPGGLDVAAHALGHEVTGIEWDAGACETREAAGLDTFKGDVRQYRAAFFPYAQVLTGGPPCQTFTVAGHGSGRRALTKVLGYIERLHEAVRTDGQDWKKIFRVWREISEELRQNELKAEALRVQKRKVEELRTLTRKTLRHRLEQLGHSADEAKALLKKLKNPRTFDFSDDELEGLLKEFSDLNDEHTALKDRLEELGDERTGLVLQPLWWVIERSRRPGSKPYEAVILEQVPAVMRVWEEYAKVLATLGYRTKTQYVHTEAFGVPQTRRRAVLMARLDRDALLRGAQFHPGKDFKELPETHYYYQLKGQRTLPPKEDWISMGKALDKARGIAKECAPELAFPDRLDFTVISNYGTGGDPKARGRRDDDAPSATITGKVSRNRVVRKEDGEDLARFTFAEAGVLQSFPVAYPWNGNDKPQQIGNAVPPRLALHLLRYVLEPELSEEEAETRLKQAIVNLETWKKPDEPVKPCTHRDLKSHPLTGR
ncbi:DNA cytosine methyltransferase [Streptomyces sp. NPDC005009]